MMEVAPIPRVIATGGGVADPGFFSLYRASGQFSQLFAMSVSVSVFAMAEHPRWDFWLNCILLIFTCDDTICFLLFLVLMI